MAAPQVDPVRRWADELLQWTIPPEILSAAPSSPWTCDPADFAVDSAGPIDNPSSAVEREVLPHTGGSSVLDVGCGGGRAAFALVPPATAVIGVDERSDMLEQFRVAAAARQVPAELHHGWWPDVAAEVGTADLVVCHHVVYNVPDIVPFLAALTAHARLAVVVELTAHHPQTAWNDAWIRFWGIERPVGPTADDLVAVVRGLGWRPEVWRHSRPAADDPFQDRDRAVRSTLRRLCLTADRAPVVTEFLDAHPLRWESEVVTLRWPSLHDR